MPKNKENNAVINWGPLLRELSIPVLIALANMTKGMWLEQVSLIIVGLYYTAMVGIILLVSAILGILVPYAKKNSIPFDIPDSYVPAIGWTFIVFFVAPVLSFVCGYTVIGVYSLLYAFMVYGVNWAIKGLYE